MLTGIYARKGSAAQPVGGDEYTTDIPSDAISKSGWRRIQTEMHTLTT